MRVSQKSRRNDFLQSDYEWRGSLNDHSSHGDKFKKEVESANTEPGESGVKVETDDAFFKRERKEKSQHHSQDREDTKIKILRQFSVEGHSKATALSSRDLGALVYGYDQEGAHEGQGVRECCECD